MRQSINMLTLTVGEKCVVNKYVLFDSIYYLPAIINQSV